MAPPLKLISAFSVAWIWKHGAKAARPFRLWLEGTEEAYVLKTSFTPHGQMNEEKLEKARFAARLLAELPSEPSGLREFDLGAQKQFPVTESKRFEFRAEFINLTNTPIFNAPSRSVTSTTFGEVTGSQGARNIQFGLKFYF